MKVTHLCGCTEAEEDAEGQMGVFRGDELQVAQRPGQTQ